MRLNIFERKEFSVPNYGCQQYLASQTIPCSNPSVTLEKY